MGEHAILDLPEIREMILRHLDVKERQNAVCGIVERNKITLSDFVSRRDFGI